MEAKNTNQKEVKERAVKGKVEIDIQRCKGCELCTDACKEKALTLSDSINIKGYRYAIANNDLCTGCVNCALVCPDAVITVYRTHPKKKPVDITPENIKEQIQTLVISSK
jgi:2-oxoglutarate ferredoxin oxidoreductase subunit delta